MKRQQIRKLTLFIALLLFPITMWYFSPAVIIMGMLQHILNGSFFVFIAMIITGMFLGRSFCGYLCPSGGIQECTMMINSKPAKQGKRRYIKFGIWILWIAGVAVSFMLGSGDVQPNFLFMTEHGISISEIHNYFVYYLVILIIFIPALICGKRAMCHYICWMAPFMIIGEKIGQVLHIPQLHVTAEQDKCISCKLCDKACPMGLSVHELVKNNGNCQTMDCINCGACVDNCPKNVLSYSWKCEK